MFINVISRGNLTVRDLTEIVNVEDYIDTEYLTTLYIVVPKYVILLSHNINTITNKSKNKKIKTSST